MNSLLTGDKAIDAVIMTPESERTPYQIAVANLNSDLRGLNKKYQNALQKRQILENEQANVQTAGEIMMQAYRDAMNKTESAATEQMNANSANANIQAGAAISGMGGLSNNPAAAAQTRLGAQNQAATMNAQVAANRDQNLGNLASQSANIPAQQMQWMQNQKLANIQEQAQTQERQNQNVGRRYVTTKTDSNDKSRTLKYLNDDLKKVYEEKGLAGLYEYDERTGIGKPIPAAKKFIEINGGPEQVDQFVEQPESQELFKQVVGIHKEKIESEKEKGKEIVKPKRKVRRNRRVRTSN